MKFGSLFAGIGGFDLGLDRSGMECIFQVEQNADCLKVLGRHWPHVPKFTDVRDFNATSIAVRPDLICGGFPCQDLSVAGRRAGLAGERSGLFFEFMRIVEQFAPEWVLIENVPGLLSSNGGRDMGAVVGTLGQLWYGWAYRVLDAQWLGVPQRRRRVFIVGCAGDFRRAAEVLFERESLPWDSAPSREAGARVAACVRGGTESGSNEQGDKIAVAATLNSGGNNGGFRSEPGEHVIPIDMRQASRGEKMTNNRCEGSSGGAPGTGIGRVGDPCPTIADSHTPAIAFQHKASISQSMNPKSDACDTLGTTKEMAVAYQCHGSNVGPMGTLRSGHGDVQSGVPFTFQTRCSRNDRGMPSDVVPALTSCEGGTHADTKPHVAGGGMAVRRLMPLETERLQGFPDDWTRYGPDGKEISDSARYRMCGNAVAVPVAQWIGRRIMAAEQNA